MNELHEHRKSYINYLNKYVSGNITPEELEKMKYHEREAQDIQRQLDAKRPTPPHSRYYDLMNK